MEMAGFLKARRTRKWLRSFGFCRLRCRPIVTALEWVCALPAKAALDLDCVIAPGLAAVINHSTAAQRVGADHWRVLTMPSLSFFRCAWLALSAFVLRAPHMPAVADPAAELGALTSAGWTTPDPQPGPGATLRMEVSVGTWTAACGWPLQSCGTLSACRFAPVGGTRLGLRCVEGVPHGMFPARHHQGLGPGLGAHGQRRPGAVLTANDAAQAGSRLGRRRRRCWQTQRRGWAKRPAPVMAGQALRQSMVKAPSLFKAAPRCVCQPKARVML